MSPKDTIRAAVAAREKLYGLLAKARAAKNARLVEELSAKIKEIDEAVGGMAAERLAGTAAKPAAGGVDPMLAAGAALAGSAGIGYGINRLAEPDTGGFKLGSWVDGFVEKCAEYGVDGAEMLESAVMSKDALWGKALLAALGLGAGAGVAMPMLGMMSSRVAAKKPEAVAESEAYRQSVRRNLDEEFATWKAGVGGRLLAKKRRDLEKMNYGENKPNLQPSDKDLFLHLAKGRNLPPIEEWRHDPGDVGSVAERRTRELIEQAKKKE